MKLIRPINVTDAMLVSSNVAEADYPAYVSTATYGLGNRVTIIAANTHLVFESLQNGNLGHVPVGGTADTWWLLVSNTNRWRMFDQSLSSITSNPDLIDVVIKPLSRVDSVALLNVDAASARIIMTDPTDGVVYDKTYSLVSVASISDYWAYCFEPIVRQQDFVASDLPPYATANIEIQVIEVGGTADIGACIVGLSLDVGDTQYGAKVGIQDYSVKQRDVYGNYSVLQRAFSKYANLTIIVPNLLVDQVQITFAQYRATPIVYIGSDYFGSTVIYGFYKDFYQTIQYANESICTLELEGLA